ncbi:MAG: arsenosugar biosynthesis radical SAM protein ArsS [Candidatus Marinimicrobia bacterium]|nr:arsenosugar biosynthesis radical SAM protein ArsS [Candidatus Neomarinimicrobiota bacterium]
MNGYNFHSTLTDHSLSLHRRPVTTLQLNMGKLCNQACLHCHVDAGPNRTENMEKETVDRLLEIIAATDSIETVDITGGAPELNPHFRFFVSQIRAMGKKVIDRCNLTVLFEPGQQDTAEFLMDHKVQIVCSLPCYTEANVDQQRGKGVFGKSIEGLLMLNALGYGIPGTGLELDLVYNPGGASLPGDQKKLESDYKQRLHQDFGIEFSTLFTITNMPIHRFEHYLNREGELHNYMDLLTTNFNACAAQEIMCRDLVSVSWDGKLFDCDFNQMLDMPINGSPISVWDISSLSDFNDKPIKFDSHCYGCTAGAGSSCTGALN